MQTLTYNGFIKTKNVLEDHNVLFVGDMDEPIAEEFVNVLNGKQVSVRYWICKARMPKHKLQESALINMFGSVDASFGARYTEITGFIGVDEEVNIGGHDLVQELFSHVGKYVHLEIDIH